MDARALEPHATAIIAHLLGTREDLGPDREALYRRVLELLPSALPGGPWEPLRAIAVHARGDALNGTADADLRRSALSVLAWLARPATADTLVRAALDGAAGDPALAALLGAAGPDAIVIVARRLATPVDPRAADRLMESLVHFGEGVWRSLADRVGGLDVRSARALVRLAARLPRRVVRETLQACCVHPDPGVAEEARIALAAEHGGGA